MPIDDVMSQGQLAAHLGRSLQKVQRWSAAGVLVPAADGNGYDVASSVRAIVGHLSEEAAGRADPALRKRHALKATRLELKIRREAGQLIEADAAKQVWNGIIRGIRQMMLALPNKICFAIPHLTRADRDIIEQICRDDLEDASLERGYLAPGPGDGMGGPAEAAGALDEPTLA